MRTTRSGVPILFARNPLIPVYEGINPFYSQRCVGDSRLWAELTVQKR